MKIADVMTTDVVTVAPATPFKEVVERMVASGVSGLPVVDDAGTHGTGRWSRTWFVASRA